MTFYGNLARTAKSLLTKFGRDVTRRRSAAGAYDPATGTTVLTPSDATFKGAMFDFDRSVTEVRGTLVAADDKRLLVEADAAPRVDDKFVVGADEYSVLSVGIVSPAGEAVIYDLHVRK